MTIIGRLTRTDPRAHLTIIETDGGAYALATALGALLTTPRHVTYRPLFDPDGCVTRYEIEAPHSPGRMSIWRDGPTTTIHIDSPHTINAHVGDPIDATTAIDTLLGHPR